MTQTPEGQLVMSHSIAIAKSPWHLGLATCLPLMLLMPQIGIADGAGHAPAAASHTPGQIDRLAAIAPERREAHFGTILTVFFAFDRAELTTASRRALDTVVPQLHSHLVEGGHVLIEGHADATGVSAYNLALSKRRARSTAAYLRDAWEIPLSRLKLRAAGDMELRRSDPPHHAENRRVEITLLEVRAPTTRRLSARPRARGHLDIDDFGGAPSPIPGHGRINSAPAPMQSYR